MQIKSLRMLPRASVPGKPKLVWKWVGGILLAVAGCSLSCEPQGQCLLYLQLGENCPVCVCEGEKQRKNWISLHLSSLKILNSYGLMNLLVLNQWCCI